MKHKIKIKLMHEMCMPEIQEKGDWIDLKIWNGYFNIPGPKAESNKYPIFEMMSLGVAMQLPEGYEAIVAPRSSTFRKYGMMLANSVGVIDGSYRGNGDIWQFPALIFKDTQIEMFERVAQFRIQLSQKATIWQKIKDLFYSGVEFEVVDSLTSPNRGGFGSTDKQK